MNENNENQAIQYLTFRIGDEVFALDVSQVREVLDFSTITKVPRAPDFMRGVINVRGNVVPVVDLRRKFGLEPTEKTLDTRIVVMELSMDDELSVLGAMADSVHEVIELEVGQIEAPPRIGTRWRTEFIKGIGKRDEQFIIILDIDRVFSTDELAMVDAGTEESAAVVADAPV
jgi:purine-binding chemotaxis protein CheW